MHNMLVTACLQIVLNSYVPGTWNSAHSNDDAIKSAVITIGRITCIKLQNEIIRGDNLRVRSYVAQYRISEVLYGKVKTGEIINIKVGDEFAVNLKENNDSYPSLEGSIVLHNTQLGYDLRINQVYLLYLDHDEDGGMDLRSGPFSIGWIKPKNKISFCSIGNKWNDEEDFDKYIKNTKDAISKRKD